MVFLGVHLLVPALVGLHITRRQGDAAVAAIASFTTATVRDIGRSRRRSPMLRFFIVVEHELAPMAIVLHLLLLLLWPFIGLDLVQRVHNAEALFDHRLEHEHLVGELLTLARFALPRERLPRKALLQMRYLELEVSHQLSVLDAIRAGRRLELADSRAQLLVDLAKFRCSRVRTSQRLHVLQAELLLTSAHTTKRNKK